MENPDFYDREVLAHLRQAKLSPSPQLATYEASTAIVIMLGGVMKALLDIEKEMVALRRHLESRG